MIKRYTIYTLVTFILSISSLSAQTDDSESSYAHLGLGLGLSYGGFGGRIIGSPTENIGLFLGLGYNLVGLGYNAGVVFSVPSQTKTQFYASGMYGTNSVIVIQGAEELNKSYSAPSFGLGLKLKSKRNPGSYWDLGLILPLRSAAFNDAWDAIKNNSSFNVQSNPWPVLINIGYNFKL